MEETSLTTLELRSTSSTIRPPGTAQSMLAADPVHHTGGLPWLHGSLTQPVSAPCRLLLRVHNRAGIPIIEGESYVAADQQTFTFTQLRPLGIDAYAHVSEAEREQIARRIWSRRAYGTLEQHPAELLERN